MCFTLVRAYVASLVKQIYIKILLKHSSIVRVQYFKKKISYRLSVWWQIKDTYFGKCIDSTLEESLGFDLTTHTIDFSKHYAHQLIHNRLCRTP